MTFIFISNIKYLELDGIIFLSHIINYIARLWYENDFYLLNYFSNIKNILGRLDGVGASMLQPSTIARPPS